MNKRVQRSAITFILSIVAMIAMVLLGGKTTAQEAAGSELSLDNVTVTSFKIIDVKNGNKEIEYKKESDAQYEAYKSDPSIFSNGINIGQSTSTFKYQLSISYKAQEILKEGDTLVIPATFDSLKSSFSRKILVDGENHELGTWEYKDGNVVIYFSGDYIKNNRVKSFKASFETGENNILITTSEKTTKLGERIAFIGTVGKEKFVAAREKLYVVTEALNDTTNSMFKSAHQTTDSLITWKFNIESDRLRKYQNGKYYNYYNPYMLENNGQYTPKTLTDIYVEDTFEDVIEKPNGIIITAFFSGIDDEGKESRTRGKNKSRGKSVFKKRRILYL